MIVRRLKTISQMLNKPKSANNSHSIVRGIRPASRCSSCMISCTLEFQKMVYLTDGLSMYGRSTIIVSTSLKIVTEEGLSGLTLKFHCPPSSIWEPNGNTGEIKAAMKGLATLPQKADGSGQVSSLTGTPQRMDRL